MNPNPARITHEMWRLWEETSILIPGVRLGGIYANKKGYHNTVNANRQKWPGNYSIRTPLDSKGPLDKARGIDLTMSTAEMRIWTNRMKISALNKSDNRLAAVREFYGTLDGKKVYGLIKDSEHGNWLPSIADDTHLWHGHTSIFTFFVNQWEALAPILSVWKGESLQDWNRQQMFVEVKQGDSGEAVKYYQYKHNLVAKSVGAPVINVDGDWREKTSAAFAVFAKIHNATQPYPATKMTGWLASKYDLSLASIYGPVPVNHSHPVVSDETIKQAVNEYLQEHLPAEFSFDGSVEGKVRW